MVSNVRDKESVMGSEGVRFDKCNSGVSSSGHQCQLAIGGVPTNIILLDVYPVTGGRLTSLALVIQGHAKAAA